MFVSALIPTFNEARVTAASVQRVLASSEVGLEVIVIDDGSSDETSTIIAGEFTRDRRVRLLTLQNGGKAHTLNRGLELASGAIVIALDADAQLEETTIARLARWFADPRIGAVAGKAKAGNRHNLVTRCSRPNMSPRRAWRRSALDSVGGYPVDTLAEDQDLTIAIQRKGWWTAYDIDAVAWTEAPESLRTPARQRFRWAFGTLPCLWKHRSILRERTPPGLAYVGFRQA